MAITFFLCLVFLFCHSVLGSVRGIEAAATTTPTSNPACGQTQFNAASGVLTSPNFPNNYPDNLDCIYTITIPNPFQNHILLYFTDFYTEAPYDYLAVYDGTNVSPNNQIGMFSGSVPFGTTIYGGSNTFTLLFHTDSFLGLSGFRVYWNNRQDICGKTTFTSTTNGVITSPNWPYNYPNDLNCTYKIMAPTGSHVEISFTSNSSLENNYDFLNIYGQSNQLLATYTGNAIAQNWKKVVSSQNLKMTFSTDNVITGQGFEAMFQVVQDNGSNPCSCGLQTRMLTNPTQRGNMYSPGFGGMFCPNATCTWYLGVPNGFLVKMTYPYMSLSKTNAQLSIYNGQGTSGTLLGICSWRYCWNAKGVLRTSFLSVASNFMTLVYTGNMEHTNGFEITWTAATKLSSC